MTTVAIVLGGAFVLFELATSALYIAATRPDDADRIPATDLRAVARSDDRHVLEGES